MVLKRRRSPEVPCAQVALVLRLKRRSGLDSPQDANNGPPCPTTASVGGSCFSADFALAARPCRVSNHLVFIRSRRGCGAHRPLRVHQHAKTSQMSRLEFATSSKLVRLGSPGIIAITTY